MIFSNATFKYRLGFYILLFNAFIFNTTQITAQSFQWAKSIESEGYDEGFDLATDSAGNTYVGGMMEFDTDFGNGVILTSAGIHDIFLAKYDPTGKLVWAKRAGGKGGDKIQSVVLDGFGHIYVAGEYEDTSYFENIMMTTAGLGINDMFIAKYDTSGSVMWVRNLSGTGTIQTRGYGVTCDEHGNVYACGGTKGDTYYQGTYLFTSAGDYDGTIVKFDPNGNFSWAKRFGGTDSDKAYGIASDKNGSIYVTGYFVGTADFSPTVNLTGNGHTDIFLAKYNTAGTLQWATMAGDTGFDRGWDVMLNVNGDIIITGEFQTGYFGTNHVFSRGNEDMFLAAYNSNGANLWAIDGGGVEDDIGRGLGHDTSGNILVIGDYASTATFSNQQITSNGFADMFAASYSSNGSTLNWIRSAGGTSNERGRGIGSDNAGNTYVCGEFEDSIHFGNTNLMGNLNLDIYVSKIGMGNQCSTQLVINSQNNCAGQCNGSAEALPTGQSPFNYRWTTTPMQMSATATGLCAGTYSVTITDAVGCTINSSVTLIDPLLLQVTTSEIDALCAGTCTGLAHATASGENPFTYLWTTSPSQNSEDATGLCMGNYSVIVTDKNGCTSTSNIGISEPAPLMQNATITNATCISCADGSIDATATGGTQGYQYLWSNGETTEDIFGIIAGTYELCITDNNICSQCSTYIVLDSGTGIADNNLLEQSVYPNPFNTSTTIHVKSSAGKTTKLILFNSTGQEVFETEFSGDQFILNANELAHGLYFIKLNNVNITTTKMMSVVVE